MHLTEDVLCLRRICFVDLDFSNYQPSLTVQQLLRDVLIETGFMVNLENIGHCMHLSLHGRQALKTGPWLIISEVFKAPKC